MSQSLPGAERPPRPPFFARGSVLLLLSVGLLGGCATVLDGQPQPVSDIEADLVALQPQLAASAVVGCLQNTTLVCRNEVVGARMYAADLRFAQFEEQLFKEGRGASFGASVASLGLSAAATASTGGTAQTLSAVNTMLLGTRESYQKDLLGERTSAAIHAAMQARRNAVALRLRTGLTQPLAVYSLPAALNDVSAYVRAGSLLGALTEITDSVSASATGVERQINDTVVADFKARDGLADELRVEICGGKQACDHKTDASARLKACAEKNGLDQPDAALSLMDGSTWITAAQRKAVLNCLRAR